MSIRVALEHTMSYRFDRSVALFPHIVRLRPAPHCRTPILAYSLTIEPAEHFINWQQDPFGNHAARLVFPAPSRELTLTVALVADLPVMNPFDFFVEESAERYPFTYDSSVALDLAPYLQTEEPGPFLARWLAGQPATGEGGRAIVDFLVEL
ncbi:MAG: transglutaminase N-terminal domain-containing protein, partial [Acidimicrobiales bacterium]